MVKWEHFKKCFTIYSARLWMQRWIHKSILSYPVSSKMWSDLTRSMMRVKFWVIKFLCFFIQKSVKISLNPNDYGIFRSIVFRWISSIRKKYCNFPEKSQVSEINRIRVNDPYVQLKHSILRLKRQHQTNTNQMRIHHTLTTCGICMPISVWSIKSDASAVWIHLPLDRIVVKVRFALIFRWSITGGLEISCSIFCCKKGKNGYLAAMYVSKTISCKNVI